MNKEVFVIEQIGRRIYYDKATGNVIVDTGEREGSIIPTTVEQDFNSYSALSERVVDSVGVIELAFGQFSQDFLECNGYRVNPTTKLLEFSYPDPSDPEIPPVYQIPLSEELVDVKARLELSEEAIDFLLMSGGMM